jgi:hypothetical protein
MIDLASPSKLIKFEEEFLVLSVSKLCSSFSKKE